MNNWVRGRDIVTQFDSQFSFGFLFNIVKGNTQKYGYFFVCVCVCVCVCLLLDHFVFFDTLLEK